MSFAIDSLRIEGGTSTWIFATLCMLLAIYLGIRTWIRMKKSGKIAFWESFRILIILLILITLFNPESVENLERAQKSQIICLQDVSNSMQTEDVIVNESKPIKRISWTQEFLKEDWIENLENNVSFIVNNFSSPSGKKATDISSAIRNAINQTDTPKAILLLTDGDTNTGSSILSVAGSSRALSIPIFSIITGSESSLPDLSLDEVFAPSFVLQEERVTINWQASNRFKSPQSTSLTLLANGQKVVEKPISFFGEESISGNLSWLPDNEGEIEFEIILGQVKGEIYKNNNTQRVNTRIEKKTIRALIVDSFPRWEYRYLRNALNRDPGVDLSCILFHPGMNPSVGENYIQEFPQDEASLAPFDVIFLGDVGLKENELNLKQCKLLSDLIQYQAAGIIFLPGRRGGQQTLSETSLSEVLPVIYDTEKPRGLGTRNPSPYTLTQRGREHWLTKLRGTGEKNREFWSKLPGFHWAATIRKTKPGSEVLAVHSNYVTEWGKMPILVIRQIGAGKSLYLGSDSAWRWRRGVEDKYHYRFWSQVVRWMAHGRYLAEKEGIKLIPSPEKPRVGEKVFLRCIVLDQNGFPLEKGEVSGTARHADGNVENLSFRPDPECQGVFLSSLKTTSAGNLEIEAICESAERNIQTKLQVEEPNLERLGNPTNRVPLEQLANLTGGISVNYQNADALISALSLIPEPKPVLRIHSLRSNLWWGGFLFLLLAIYWTGRKFFGMV
ncbi:MAG: hypothetical protein VX130_01550 [Verrucomicrobiota bacterium]|nr:hypothetical protein [Verrucomicrobiota bacterium]